MNDIGRSVEQTERFIRDVIEPLKERYEGDGDPFTASEPRV